MTETDKRRIADAAGMIVGGYAFLKEQGKIKVVNLNIDEPHVMIISPSGEMLESSMDPIEQQVALDIWQEDSEFMEAVDA